MSSIPRVVIALCYKSIKNNVVVYSCPFCFCSHTHHVRKEYIKKPEIKHFNGEVVDYNEDMITKISDCMFTSRTYALEIRDQEELDIKEKKLCVGITKKNTPCKNKVKSTQSVCKRHYNQLEQIIQNQIIKIFGT